MTRTCASCCNSILQPCVVYTAASCFRCNFVMQQLCTAEQAHAAASVVAPLCARHILGFVSHTCTFPACPALPRPAPPCPALPRPALPCPALPCPALPCPALPCPAPLLQGCLWHDRGPRKCSRHARNRQQAQSCNSQSCCHTVPYWTNLGSSNNRGVAAVFFGSGSGL